VSRSRPTIRPAERRDAADLVILTDLAGHGLPGWLWGQAASRGEATALEYGRSRVLREGEAYSWRNAHVAEIDGAVAGMLLGYRQPNAMQPPDPGEGNPVLHPLGVLEAQAPGTWYVNILAVYPEFRERGVAAEILGKADELAAATGAHGLSLIMQDDNLGALRVYDCAGYRIAARRPFRPFPGASPAKEWLLLVKPRG
jgi:ribosomal protein S18 acetylase RimI-like enzyme